MARNEPRRVPRPPREGEGDPPAAGRREASEGSATHDCRSNRLLLIQSKFEKQKEREDERDRARKAQRKAKAKAKRARRAFES